MFKSLHVLDLDSLASSIIYAFIRTISPKPSMRTPFSPDYVPLLNIPAADVGLRPEFTLLLDSVGLKPSELITLDDLPAFDHLSDDLQPEDTAWVLVDHNKLEGTLGKIYAGRVNGVIDHHAEENSVPRDVLEYRSVEPCGSCTSLVVYKVIMLGRPNLIIPHQIAMLGLASVLIDTKNLRDKSKTRDIDNGVWDKLWRVIRSKDQSFDPTTFFHDLDRAKRNIDHLPLQGILRKDYKEWTEAGMKLGTSSSVKSLSFLEGKAQEECEDDNEDAPWDRAAAAFMEHRSLNIWAVNTTVVCPESKETPLIRELVLQWLDRSNEIDAVKRFEETHGSELGLSLVKSPGMAMEGKGWHRKRFRQMDLTQTRKEIAPMLRQAMQESQA